MPYTGQPKGPSHYLGGLSKYLIAGANLGSVFYVDGCAGSDDNTGLVPSSPLLTIAAALAMCTNDLNDTIVVLDYYNLESDLAVTINKSKVTLVGSEGGSRNRSWTCINATADTACFIVAANDVRIHQFHFDAGDNHAGIEFSGAKCRIGIYDCDFGTGKHGILSSPGGVAFNLDIVNNFFCQALTAQSIYINDDPAFFSIVGNILDQPQGVGIEVVQGGGGQVRNNVISLPSNTAGAAITLGASVYRCIVDGNHANYGDTEMGLIPYTDNAAAGQNHWMLNYKGITATMPN
uniref:Putative pectate lyase n=1 Tax=viral metagenome TaxID=1070528 RepID=A0A6M3M4L2_9ZZZZ